MHYYDLKQDLALVDKKDNIVGRIDKWEAHKKGLLHRAFTIALIYKDQIVLQHRRHPVFDGYYDLTCSSHPVYIGDILQTFEQGFYTTLKREWNLDEGNTQKMEDKGSVYYQARDPNSIYGEHEICHLLVGEISLFPSPNYEFAYGFSLVSKKSLLDKKNPLRGSFAPWVPLLLDLL